jgi:hypothetical protein
VVLGTAFLVTQNIPDGGRIMWPATIIALGVWMVTRHNAAVNGKRPEKNYSDYTEVK